MSAELISQLAELQSRLVSAMQEEYFCEDLVPPPAAFGWDAAALRAFFESGGETLPESESKPEAAPARELGPPDSMASGRPLFLALGDSLTEFGHHVCDPSWDKKAPFASDVLQRAQMDVPIPEHGPGWLSLLQRDYSYRTAADVLNRGYSGCNSRTLRRDLAELLAPINRQDVFAVTVAVGSNDHVAGSPGHVPKQEFRDNMAAILATLQEVTLGRREFACRTPRPHAPSTLSSPQSLPNAKLVLITPGRINKDKWAAHVSAVTSGRLDGGGRGEQLMGVVTQVRGGDVVGRRKGGGVGYCRGGRGVLPI
jgi:hypothetical protein